MDKKRCILAFLLVIACGFNTQAQRTAVSAFGGTQGLGLEIKYSPIPAYGVRGGFGIFPIDESFLLTTQATPSDVKVKADFKNVHLAVDWHPFKNDDGFRKFMLSAGAGYFWKNTGTAVITPKQTYNYGDIVLGPGDAGQLVGTVKWQKVAPYAGIGFESAVPATRFNIGFVLGAYYLGKPETDLVGTKLISVDNANEVQFRKNLENYRFLPVIQLNLNYTIF